jgi:hypothetical protein
VCFKREIKALAEKYVLEKQLLKNRPKEQNKIGGGGGPGGEGVLSGSVMRK